MDNVLNKEIEKMSLYEKIFCITHEVEKIQKIPKDRKSDFSFEHVTSELVLKAIKQLTLKYKIVIIPNDVSQEFIQLTGKKQTCYCKVTIEYEIINLNKPEDKIVKNGFGHGLDSGERCIGKAKTYAEKYFLLKLFQVETTKDDPDYGKNQNSGENERTQSENLEIESKANELIKKLWNTIFNIMVLEGDKTVKTIKNKQDLKDYLDKEIIKLTSFKIGNKTINGINSDKLKEDYINKYNGNGKTRLEITLSKQSEKLEKLKK